MPLPPVPFDRELQPLYDEYEKNGVPLSPDNYAEKRAAEIAMTPDIHAVIGDQDVEFEDRVIPGQPGGPDLTVAILRPKSGVRTSAAMYYIHGGGMYEGTRFTFLESFVEHVVNYGCVAIAVEYRLAPEHQHPIPVEDCYAGLVWAAEHAEELGFDPGRIVVMGGSAGGGLAAGVALLARDRGGPAMAGQGLQCPMIDDRDESVSTRQFDGIGVWNRATNRAGWGLLLGDRVGGPDVDHYAAPSRAEDLSNLPPAFIDAGACEVFRDEAVDYASRIWATGGQAELHIWAGGYHGFTTDLPEALICKASKAARNSWLERVLELPHHEEEA